MKRLPVLLLALSGCLSLAPLAASAQSPTVDVYSPQQLMQMMPALREQAMKSGGVASKTIETYPDHYTMLAFRDKSGQAELHQAVADILVVISGNATLVTGGSIVNPKTTAPAEVRGDSVQGGTSAKLSKGDIIHIPANIPHQMLLSGGGSITYFVIKVDTP